MSNNTRLVVEVGPGPGLLSRSILDAGAKQVIAIEKDDRFIPTLHVSFAFIQFLQRKKKLKKKYSNYQRLQIKGFKYYKEIC